VRKTLLNLTQTLKKYSLTPEEIDYEEDGEMTLHYDDVLVEFGSDEHLNEKVQRLEKILPSLDGMSGTLHMEDWSEETSEIIFRKSS
jgi:cell division protein FtsQ